MILTVQMFLAIFLSIRKQGRVESRSGRWTWTNQKLTRPVGGFERMWGWNGRRLFAFSQVPPRLKMCVSWPIPPRGFIVIYEIVLRFPVHTPNRVWETSSLHACLTLELLFIFFFSLQKIMSNKQVKFIAFIFFIRHI